jgi:hypothetical protein
MALGVPAVIRQQGQDRSLSRLSCELERLKDSSYINMETRRARLRLEGEGGFKGSYNWDISKTCQSSALALSVPFGNC